MARHKDESGASLHESKITRLNGNPISLNTVASIAGIMVADVSIPNAPVLYIANSTTPGDWKKASGGSGGGGSINFRAGVSAPGAGEDIEFDQKVFKFTPAGGQKIFATIKVPAGYAPGSPISMKAEIYSPSVVDTILLQSVSSLIRTGVDAAGSTTNQRTSTNTALTNTAPANRSREVVLDLTSSTGQINGVNVSAGDVIEVALQRGTDTDTADIRFRPDSIEVSFA